MSKSFIPYGKQSIDARDINAVIKVLKGDWLTQGPTVAAFEKAMAEYCNAPYALAVSSGTAALHLAYLAAGIKKGDEVITCPLTFLATSSALAYIGAVPIFVDINPETLTIDPAHIEEKITKRTKAISVIDFAGYPCEYETIRAIARKHHLILIADAAHSLGSQYSGARVGSLADITILSFHPVKTMTTGEGGMLLTDKKEYYERAARFRHHGMIKKPEVGGWYYELEEPGYNYRITDMQCALGLSQLKKLNSFISKRRAIVKEYNKAFAKMPQLKTVQEQAHIQAAWHLYVVQLNLAQLRVNRKTFFEKIHAQGIGVQVHYMPLHLQPFFKRTYGYKKGDFPFAEGYYECALSLPLYPAMKHADVKKVIRTLQDLITQYRI